MDSNEIKRLLSTYTKRRLNRPGLKPAAVLVPIYCDAGDCHIVFAQRSQNVVYHKGQNAFPGGRPHQGDRDLLATALRESYEEIGLKPEKVEIIGELDDQETTSGFAISPYVGIIPSNYPFIGDGNEVANIFSVPLSAFLDSRRWREEPPGKDGIGLPVYHIEHDGRVIWGATARVMKQLTELLSTRSGASR